VSVPEILYDVAMTAARPLLPLAGAFSPKLAAAVAGRRTSVASARAWSRAHRRNGVPLLLLHGASAGELAGAAPIVRRVREATPGLQLAVSYSSPSGESVANGLRPDWHGFPPLDTRRESAAWLAALRPSALVFAKLDVWPGLARSAARAGVPAGMVNAVVRPGSGRLRGPSTALLRPAYASLAGVGAVSASEIPRLRALGVREEAIRVTGDAAFERALDRLDDAATRGTRLPPTPSGTVRLVAGSTWPDDEEVLLHAVRVLESRDGATPRLELVIVPHEPTPEAVARLAALCRATTGRDPRFWSRVSRDGAPPESGDPARPLVIDAVGFLAELYAEADVALVGGAFGGTGLHSVVEPAAAGRPVLFGPNHDRWEARALVERGAAVELRAADAAEVLARLSGDPMERDRMGTAARRWVEEGRGAAQAGADLALRLLELSRA
jgi:3-deoxy-D-manno-octulosonic-acid transferase